jgi:hypothetical protein
VPVLRQLLEVDAATCRLARRLDTGTAEFKVVVELGQDYLIAAKAPGSDQRRAQGMALLVLAWVRNSAPWAGRRLAIQSINSE